MMTVFIFGVRGFISGAFQGFYVYTPEVHVIDWTKNYTKENKIEERLIYPVKVALVNLDHKPLNLKQIN